MELKETHRIVCSSRSPRGPSGTGTVEAHQQAFDRITGSVVGRTRILHVLSADELVGDPESKSCRVCAEKMQVAHVEVRKKAWAALPEVFGLIEM